MSADLIGPILASWLGGLVLGFTWRRPTESAPPRERPKTPGAPPPVPPPRPTRRVWKFD